MMYAGTRLMRQRRTSFPFVTGVLQRKSASSSLSTGAVPSIVDDVLRSPGQPLDSTTREFMEPRFGYDFSHVRVHTDQQAATSARAVEALAYTVGSHLVFEHGQYAPDTPAGRRLLSHELTHSIQQSSVGESEVGTRHLRLLRPSSASSLEIGRPDSSGEVEADHVSHQVDSGFNVTPSMSVGSVLQREPVRRPAQTSSPEAFGISLVVVDHGATGVAPQARAQLNEIYRSLSATNLGVLQSSGITQIELHISPYDKKIVELPEFAHMKGDLTPDGRLWDDVRGSGGERVGSKILYTAGEENFSGGRHGHGAAIGFGIGLGVLLGAGGAALGQSIGSKSDHGLLGGILGGVLGAGVGAVGGGLLGDLIDSSTASGYARNFTASHEGAHTIELSALTPAQQARVQTLFAERKAAGGPWLEPADYTSSNEHEYWAQCAAAFFSRPYSGSDADQYNPEWLRRNDPGMYALLNEVFNLPSGTRVDQLDMRYRQRAAA